MLCFLALLLLALCLPRAIGHRSLLLDSVDGTLLFVLSLLLSAQLSLLSLLLSAQLSLLSLLSAQLSLLSLLLSVKLPQILKPR